MRLINETGEPATSQATQIGKDAVKPKKLKAYEKEAGENAQAAQTARQKVTEER